MIDEISKLITDLREKVPLVQCITNYVTINDCANILLAYGASPAMCEAYDESYDFAKMADALYINVGTLTKEQEASSIMAAISAKNNDTPVILDPVGCAGIKRKMDVINKILTLGKVDVIKGNVGEIKFLAGIHADIRGVDSIDSGEGVDKASQILAQKYNCTVAASGPYDIVTDGKRMIKINNGTKMFTKITGAGCMLGALCGGAIAVSSDKFIAAVSALVSMSIAGEEAFKTCTKPGSFRVKLIDEIYDLDENKIKELARIDIIK
ncbi:MAG: hydroxyethylthiazole kinase [Clostridium sp.]|nr:hydroxyethylthiazole kinase [Clostridium sp.]